MKSSATPDLVDGAPLSLCHLPPPLKGLQEPHYYHIRREGYKYQRGYGHHDLATTLQYVQGSE
jgi:hypothetical protein